MGNLKNLVEEWLKADSAAISDTNAENFDCVTEKKSDDVPKDEKAKDENDEQKTVEQSPSIQSADVADDVPIYTATTKEINYWHACVNIHVLDFLRWYDFDRETAAFSAFKIGVDTEKHAVTFALDDTHYLKFDLNDTNVRPLDEEQAEKVLRRANAMRFEKIKSDPLFHGRKW